MKKSIPIVTFFTIVCFLTTIFHSTYIVKGDTILPDKNEIQIQKHMKKIDELTRTLAKNEQASAVNNYLSTLNSKDLLETAAEYSTNVNSEQDRNDYLSIIAPHLARAWQQGIPYEDVSNIIKDKTYDNNFRMFTVDIATTLNQNKGQHDAGLINSIYSIALDNNENTELRRHVLLDLTEPGAYKASDDTTGKSNLEEIFKEPNLAPEVKSAVITAMRRTQDPKFEETVTPILKDLKSYPSITIRHAVVESATAGYSTPYIKQMTDLVASTNDKAVYGSTILALGINGGIEAIKSIVSNYGRFDNQDICNYSLERNHKTVMGMLNLNQSSDMIQLGISVAKLTKVDSYITPLEQIHENIKDPILLTEADQVLKALNNDSIPSNPKSEEASK